MKTAQPFQADLVELAHELHAKGRISRRDFVAGLAMLGALPTALRAGPAGAQAQELVLCNWGGDAIPFFEESWTAPYTADTGITVVQDGSGPSLGKIRAMVEAGAVAWDVCDSGGGSSIQLGEAGLIREIDYNVVDRSKLFPGHDFRWGQTNYIYSFVLGYDTTEFGDNPPTSWADFFNLDDFPGPRSLRKDVLAHVEIALMGAGVPKDEIYPITPDKEKLAFEMFEKIKADTIFWNSGAESQQMMRDRSVVMGCFWNTRLKVIHEETEGEWDWTWNQGMLMPGAWVVPMNNPAGDAIWPFLASTQTPERQVRLFELFANAPANPEAAPLVPPELKKFNATDPDNYAVQLPSSSEYWGANLARVNTTYLDLIAT
ncbi:extracellular solute-binding protein [Marinivivus vitaminiproducens]|uniref:extracellular solute-binding protein n=1 Tax=Marinivivus vitaminiproducens TaxID=3035935 RepID=UPI00279D3ADB|nr:extracellular solute-binding protein [Geminicoccaceae bacterium SCSIO 64248]